MQRGEVLQSVRASPYCQQDHPYDWLAPSSLSSSWLLALVWVQSKESAFGSLHLPRSLTPIFHPVTSQDLSWDHHPLRELDLSRVYEDTLTLDCLDTAVCVTGDGKAKAPPHLSAPPTGGIAFE